MVCLAASLKNGGLCLAGREVADRRFGAWLRPVSARDTAELTYLEYRYADHTSPSVLDVVDVPLLEPLPHGHQTENVLVDPTRRWVKRGRAAFRRLKDLREEPDGLWSNAASTATGHFNCMSPEEALVFRSSLCLIAVEDLQIEVGRGLRGERACKGLFTYKDVDYKLSITDPAIREVFEPRGLGVHPIDRGGDLFLCISLSEAFRIDGRCHKLIATVLTDPAL
jgi:hypothetical protein